ncbi:MAG TPA: GNAT family N-acetyltransferase [Bacteroidia bacterium]|jgi:ribosomal-protein-alanine N-acetyltransferase|nr:GNAT family N-acetyltransferase [Bacteroidia bacterium]
MKDIFETERLQLSKISLDDAPFIFELVNTPGWLKFIGDRNVRTLDDAQRYIEKLLNTPKLTYWTVRSKSTLDELGVITFMKRDYLDYYDIGFAFLSQHMNKGYAFEASNEVLNYALKELKMPTVVATTLADNIDSISLLEKLGLQFEKRIAIEKLELLVYSTK